MPYETTILDLKLSNPTAIIPVHQDLQDNSVELVINKMKFQTQTRHLNDIYFLSGS